jgi:LysM repeat protein
MRTFFTTIVLVLVTLVLSTCGQIITPTPAIPSPAVQAEVPLEPRATATPLFATPAPTFTPTITPTPIIYVVQKGDTLLGIAAQFGVSVEAIQEANGIIDPRQLQIGQELVIPQDEGSQASPPTPTSTAVPYAIENVGLYETPAGGLWFLGEMHNITTADIEQVQVEVSLQDEKNQVLARATAFTALDIIPSGGRAPFAVLFKGPPPAFATYQAIALSAVMVARLGPAYRDLAVVNQQGKASEGLPYYVVTGEVRNTGQSEAEAVTVVITAYDAAGLVTGVRASDLTVSVLAPGQSVPFQANLSPAGSEIVTHTVQVQGRRVE